jgi:LysM repeat protein
MRFEPPMTPTVTSTDASGFPQLARSPLAFARSAPAFTRALAAAQLQPGGELVVPGNLSASLSGSLAPASSVAPWSASVQAGQTLSGIVREQMSQRGVNISNNEAMRLAQTVARANNISNPNLIHPGQRLNLDSLNLTLLQAQSANKAMAANASPSINNNANTSVALAGTAQVQLLSRVDRSNNPVLEKTIDRAIDKGFIPAQDKQAVMNKIVQLSEQHRFAPDDFARLTLMESDGMNPKASNSSCHGIILGHSVLKQLDMVGKYFEDTGLKNFGPVGLDDLYLTVLTPAARNETRPNVGLNIPGKQAAYLHVNRDTRAPITRNSILAGLHQNANERLGTEVAQRTPMQAIRLSAYAAQAAVSEVR